MVLLLCEICAKSCWHFYDVLIYFSKFTFAQLYRYREDRQELVTRRFMSILPTNIFPYRHKKLVFVGAGGNDLSFLENRTQTSRPLSIAALLHCCQSWKSFRDPFPLMNTNSGPARWRGGQECFLPGDRRGTVWKCL